MVAITLPAAASTRSTVEPVILVTQTRIRQSPRPTDSEPGFERRSGSWLDRFGRANAARVDSDQTFVAGRVRARRDSAGVLDSGHLIPSRT